MYHSIHFAIRALASGYERKRCCHTHSSLRLILAILTFPVGLVVDAVTGSWYGFDTKDYVVDFKANKTISPENTDLVK